ncbi:MAG TPA: hypothetical protein VFS42_01550 [Burkholderiaceae bacterium]|nr:hypothetical protein [Burkholderiaceae bacterium]
MTTTPSPRFFELRSGFQSEVLEMVNRAQSELLMFDPTYADWPGQSAELAAALEAFVKRGSNVRLHMVIDRNERVAADYPRLVNFLTRYQHVAECRALPERYANLAETMIVTDAASALRRPSTTTYRGVARVLDIEYAAALRSRFMELWEACHERFSPTTLGL